MIRSYLVRRKDNRLFCFYHQADKGILYRVCENGKWGKENRLIDNGRENFTVNVDNKGAIYIFCQDVVGDIILCGSKSEGVPRESSAGDWSKKVILKNQQSKIRVVQLNTIFSDAGLCLVYNVPHAENYIVRQMLDENGNWSPAEHIDRFVSFSDCLFNMQRVSKEHYILYYMNKSGEYNLGYREITPKNHSQFHSFHTTGYIISDSSFLTTYESIHALYVVKSMFSSQLIYRRRETASFSNPIVLAEASKIDNCLLFFAGRKLFVTYITNSQLFYIISDDNGMSFSRPARYKNKFCLGPIRAVYISEPNQSEKEFFCRQVYVDAENPWDAQLLPELCDSFYPETAPFIEPAKAQDKAVHVKPEAPETTKEDDFYSHAADELNELKEEIGRLKNQLSMSEEILADKDRQIIELSSIMQNRSEEMNRLEFERRGRYRELSHEHEKALGALSELDTKYAKLLGDYNEVLKKLEALEMEDAADTEEADEKVEVEICQNAE